MSRLVQKILIFCLGFTLSFSGVSAYERDLFVDETLTNYDYVNLDKTVPFCNHENMTRVKIVMSPLKDIKSKDAVDGDIVDFVVRKDVYYNDEMILLEGMRIKGHIETVVTQGMNGIPAMIFLEDFDIPGIPKEKLKSRYMKKGLNLSYIVFPLKWALTILPPSGSLTNFIIGGPAKISPRNKVSLYYYPEWECFQK